MLSYYSVSRVRLLYSDTSTSNSRVSSGRYVGGLVGLTFHWLRTTPLLVTLKFGLGVRFDPLRKVKNPNSSLNRSKLMSDIIQTPKKYTEVSYSMLSLERPTIPHSARGHLPGR